MSKKILVEVLKETIIGKLRMHPLAPAKHTWMTPIIEYLQHSILPNDHEGARKVRIKAPSYAILDGVLYRKGFMSLWLKFVEETKGVEALR